MHEHRIVHGLDEALKQLLAIQQLRSAPLQILEQTIDRRAQLPQSAGLRARRYAAGGPARIDEILNLAREIVDRALLAPLPHEKHEYAHCQNSRGD